MCGILAIVGEDIIDKEELENLRALIDMRGPDYSSPSYELQTKCGLRLNLKASVLHLRGNEMQKQPVIDKHGNALMFNGQIYEFSGDPLDKELSDTSFLAGRLKMCKSKVEIAETFSAIDGPFSFIYWHNDINTLFYGRDLFGRKSLCSLQGKLPYPQAISSLGKQDSESNEPCGFAWSEVNCMGFHCIEFNSVGQSKQTRFMWSLDDIYPVTKKCELFSKFSEIEIIFLQQKPLAPLNCDLRSYKEFSDDDRKLAVDGFEDKLIRAVAKRVVYNRKACLKCRRIEPTTVLCHACDHSKVAVAFSGGIDSTLLAFVLDKVFDKVETIDLITVAFKSHSPDRISVGNAFKELRKLCPDRNWRLVLCDITKSTLQVERRKSIRHLISPCDTVVDDSLGCGCWFIGRAEGRALDSLINDTEFNEVFEPFLLYNDPTSDDKNSIVNAKVIENYTSPATMFFAGMGIDEQLGGYSSHRAAWSNSGTQGVNEEISFQMRRIYSRNLGRDDRTFSQHGRDVKLPYLDYDLVSYLNQLPVGLKMDLDEPLETGPKKLLRDLAFRWGLKETSRRVKRALQFGTRIANLEHPKEKGNEICSRLT